jgi:hypothetical protein
MNGLKKEIYKEVKKGREGETKEEQNYRNGERETSKK